MNYFDLYSSYPDRTIAAAWDSQIKEAAKTPGLAEILLPRGSELFPRFAACYAELRSLPRSVRRALQRRIARSRELAAILPEYLQQSGRRLQHRMAWPLAGAALLLALGQGAATAATITVTTNDPRIIADGQCSLIEAIVNANNDAATHADCLAGNGPDTIVLPAQANVRLSVVRDNTYGPTGLPLITSPITIQGNNAKIVRRIGASRFRLMGVSNSGDLTLQNVTLSGGISDKGGAVINYGAVTIQNSVISGNRARSDSYAVGGGVFNAGTLTIDNSTISRNTATRTSSCCSVGGGVVNSTGTLTINSSTISGNKADFVGGMLNSNGGVIIQDSTIAKNSALGVGGVFNYGTLTIVNSTISGNKANYTSGGVFNSAGFYGAGSLTITSSTISGNIANNAGGVFNSSFCYYYCYSSGALTLDRSLITGNRAASGPQIENFGTVTADNFNLFGANGNAGVTGFVPGLTDIVPAPGVRVRNILGLLRNNGGPTKTHALKPGSPALDAVPFTDPSCTGADQRGVTRPQGTGCDIGAFERDGP